MLNTTDSVSGPLPLASVQPHRGAFKIGEAALWLGCCKKTLERLRDGGKLRCLLIGSRWYVTPEELRAFIKRNERKK